MLARSWLRAAGRSANMMFSGAGLFKEGTLYFTPESRRFVPKIYYKFDEINSKDKNTVYLMNCYRYLNWLNTLKSPYALKLKYFPLN